MREMKDSGIPWIGEIPQEWETHRLKAVFSSRISGEWGDDAQGDDNDKVCLRIADFDYKRLRFKQCESYTIRNYSKRDENLPYLTKGDILIEKSGGGEKTPVGRAIIYDLDFKKAMYANFMTRLRVKSNINSWFVEYMLSTLYSYGALNIYIKQTTGIQNLDITTMLEEEKIFLPSLAEQQRIAEFLDRKCAEVDEMIGLQEQIIEELKAYKQSVITEAVTKGLNPAAPMRDSGIEWIGQIPEHWELCKLKRKYRLLNGRAYSDNELLSEGKYRILRVGNLFTSNHWYYSDLELEDNKYCEKGDLLYGWSASIGPYMWEEEKVIYHYHIWKVLFAPNIRRYAYYQLQALTDAKKKDMHGTAMQHLTMDNMNNSYIATAPIIEQQAIADYLDEKCADIDSLIQTKQEKIDSLKEYKKSIIYEYVTGKREVE